MQKLSAPITLAIRVPLVPLKHVRQDVPLTLEHEIHLLVATHAGVTAKLTAMRENMMTKDSFF